MVSRGLDRRWLVAVLAMSLGACVDEQSPPQTITVASADPFALDAFEVVGDDQGDDPCELAASLPTENMCSLICRPDELAARMLEGGMHAQACYQLRCVLSDAMTVSVGVCLP
jgi:hypothetical protein